MHGTQLLPVLRDAKTVSEEEGDTVDCGGMKARIAAALDQGKDLSCILKRITYH